LKWILDKWDVGVDWIDLSHDGDQWLALVDIRNGPLGYMKLPSSCFAFSRKTQFLGVSMHY
jgi:hypothetical protein